MTEPCIPVIDALRCRPHVRHRVAEDLDRGWVRTKCNRRILYYWRGDSLLNYADGRVYARYCSTCFPEHKA